MKREAAQAAACGRRSVSLTDKRWGAACTYAVTPAGIRKYGRWTEGSCEGWAAGVTSFSWFSSAGRTVEQSNFLWCEDGPQWVMSVDSPLLHSRDRGVPHSDFSHHPAWLSLLCRRDRESQYPGSLPVATGLPVIKQGVYLSCEAVGERGGEIYYNKQCWKFIHYLHPCRVQCSGVWVWVWVFSVRILETGVPSMHILCRNACHLTFQLHFCQLPSVPEPGVTISNRVDLLTNRVYTCKWVAQSSHSAWSDTHFSPQHTPYSPLLTSSFESALKRPGTFFL